VRKLRRTISLEELKALREDPELSDLALFKYGRLSVQHVTAAQWAALLRLE
jgi:predicted RNA-binding protein with PUA-like domain